VIDGHALILIAVLLTSVGVISLFWGWVEFGNQDQFSLAKVLTLSGVGLLTCSLPMWVLLVE
jgi:hypothetical protein